MRKDFTATVNLVLFKVCKTTDFTCPFNEIKKNEGTSISIPQMEQNYYTIEKMNTSLYELKRYPHDSNANVAVKFGLFFEIMILKPVPIYTKKFKLNC